MSVRAFSLPIGPQSRRVPLVEVTPLEQFAIAKGMSADKMRNFLVYVESMGGSFYTDMTTLRLLFELWKEKGKQ